MLPGISRIKCRLQVLGSADLDAGAHGGHNDAGADILTLGSGGLGKGHGHGHGEGCCQNKD